MLPEGCWHVRLSREHLRSTDRDPRFEGNALLQWDPDGFFLRLAGKAGATFELPDTELREVRVVKTHPLTFLVDFGGRGGHLLRRFLLTKGDADALLDRLESLPPEAGAAPCPACRGPAIGGVCGDCGRGLRESNRKAGLVQMGVGVALIAAGALATYLFSGWIFWGAVFAGLATLGVGFVRLVFGVRG